ncbi:MAG: FtsX-like permease family protein [Bdellovibrionota bacterium]
MESWIELLISGEVLNLQNVIFAIIVTVVFVIMISAVINTSLMTVMERTREIGTLTALGYRRKHIMFLFLSESAYIITWRNCWSSPRMGCRNYLGSKGIVFALPGQRVATNTHPYIPWSFILLASGLRSVLH